MAFCKQAIRIVLRSESNHLQTVGVDSMKILQALTSQVPHVSIIIFGSSSPPILPDILLTTLGIYKYFI